MKTRGGASRTGLSIVTCASTLVALAGTSGLASEDTAAHRGASAVLSHSGAVDPASEGWTHITEPFPGFGGPIFDDLGEGIEAWRTGGSVVEEQNYFYRYAISTPPGACLDAICLNATYRVGPVSTPSTCAFLTLRDGAGKKYQVLSASDETTTTFRVRTAAGLNPPDFPGDDFVVPGNGYHAVELRLNLLSGVATLTVNGNVLTADYAGYIDSGPDEPVASWGSGQPMFPGEAYWQSVELFLSQQSVCAGDLDGDCDTDVFDFSIFASNFGSMGLPPNINGDFDGDGDVDVFDFGIFAPNFGCQP